MKEGGARVVWQRDRRFSNLRPHFVDTWTKKSMRADGIYIFSLVQCKVLKDDALTKRSMRAAGTYIFSLIQCKVLKDDL